MKTAHISGHVSVSVQDEAEAGELARRLRIAIDAVFAAHFTENASVNISSEDESERRARARIAWLDGRLTRCGQTDNTPRTTGDGSTYGDATRT